jgi:hypothetical protein
MWEVEVTDDWREWFFSLDEGAQDAIAGSVGLLQTVGPSLGRPHADTAKGSRHANLKELRAHAAQGRTLPNLFRLRSPPGGDPAHRRVQGGR